MNHLLCGAGKRCITPSAELLEDLVGLNDQKFGGVLDDLYVRALLLRQKHESVLIVVFELDNAPQPVRYSTAIQNRFDLSEEEIFITAVHTLSAPVSGDRSPEGNNDISKKPEAVRIATRKYEDFLLEMLMEAVEEAFATARSAKLGYLSTDCYLNVDRKQWYTFQEADGKLVRRLAQGANYASDIDRKLYIIKLEDEDKNMIGLLLNYPVHCSVMRANRCFDGKIGISSDIAGRVSAYLENEFPGAVVLWTSGAAGDINPIMQNELYYPEPHIGDMVQLRMSGDACRNILTLLASNMFACIMQVIRDIRCHIDNPRICSMIEWSRTPGKDYTYEVRLHMLQLGKLVVIAGSGEFYDAYVHLARKSLPVHDVILMNHEFALAVNSGYIMDDMTLSAVNCSLPGVERSNMKAGEFMQDFCRHIWNMYAAIQEIIHPPKC